MTLQPSLCPPSSLAVPAPGGGVWFGHGERAGGGVGARCALGVVWQTDGALRHTQPRQRQRELRKRETPRPLGALRSARGWGR